MIDVENKAYMPNKNELREFVANSAFDCLCGYLEREYNALASVEYSGDKALLGWNIKFKKAGRTLCTVYPRRGHFPLLLIVGQKEKRRVEALLPTFSEKFKKVYSETDEGMGQRWLLFDVSAHDELLADILAVVKIRRESK